MYAIIFVLIGLAITTINAGDELFDGPCPTSEVEFVKNLNHTKGRWYVVQRYKTSDYMCTEILYTWISEHRAFKERLSEHAKNSGYLNDMRVVENETFSDNGIYLHFLKYPYYYVDTDYDNYAVVWRCEPAFLESNKHYENLMVMGTTPNFDVYSSAALNATLAKPPFDRSKLKDVVQSKEECE